MADEFADFDPLKNIVFISIPENFERQIGNFRIDPSILLPVEVPSGSTVEGIADLSWEMIIAAMLKILAYRPDHEHANYFRSFILALRPDIVNELSETAVLKARNRDFDLAEEIFQALDGLLPDNARITLNLALLYEERAEAYRAIEKEQLADEYEARAFDAYKAAITIDPDQPDIHLNAGYFFLKQNNYQKAYEHFAFYVDHGDDPERRKKARDILRELETQNLMDSLFKESFDYIKLGREEEGIAKIRQFIDRNPNVWNAWFLLGWGYRRLGRYGEGKEAFRKALDLGPVQTDILNELAICQMEMGELDESRKQLTRALQMEPDNVKIISNLGILALKTGNREEAAGFFRTVLDIDPEDQVAEKYLEFLEKS